MAVLFLVWCLVMLSVAVAGFMNMNDVVTFIKSNELMLGLLLSAIVSAMPEQLPADWKALPAWWYGWLHDTLKTFMNYRKPQAK